MVILQQGGWRDGMLARMNYQELIEQQGFSVIVQRARTGWACTLERDGLIIEKRAESEYEALRQAYEFAETHAAEPFDCGAS